MKQATALLALLLAVGWVGTHGGAVSVGVSVGYEITGLVLVGALTELPIGASLDVRAQVGFAASNVAGLMLVTTDLLAHWLVPPIDPYAGVGIGAALTPSPYSSGAVAEGIAGLRAAPSEAVQLFLQVRYLLRRSGVGWSAGPVFEGGLLARF